MVPRGPRWPCGRRRPACAHEGRGEAAVFARRDASQARPEAKGTKACCCATEARSSTRQGACCRARKAGGPCEPPPRESPDGEALRLHAILECEARVLGDSRRLVLGGISRREVTVALHAAMAWGRPLGALLCARTCFMDNVTSVSLDPASPLRSLCLPPVKMTFTSPAPRAPAALAC